MIICALALAGYRSPLTYTIIPYAILSEQALAKTRTAIEEALRSIIDCLRRRHVWYRCVSLRRNFLLLGGIIAASTRPTRSQKASSGADGTRAAH